MRRAVLLGAVGGLVTVLGLRHSATHWGATEEEVGMILPGEDLVPHPNLVTTSAVTIQATPDEVWPWLMQFGQGRAGWYQDSIWWDTLVGWYYRVLSRERTGQAGEGYTVRTPSTLLPELRTLQVGDVIPDGPPGTVAYIVRQLEPRKALVLYSDTHLPYIAPGWMRESPSLGIHGELSDAYLLRPLPRRPHPAHPAHAHALRTAAVPPVGRAVGADLGRAADGAPLPPRPEKAHGRMAEPAAVGSLIAIVG